MLLAAKQIDPTSLGLFIGSYVSGTFLSGALQAYFYSSGWVGPNVLYLTGVAPQTVQGSVVFSISPTVPYSGTTGTVSSAKWTLDLVSSTIAAFSGFSTGTFVDLFSAQTIGGNKTFTGQTNVAWPIQSGAAVPFQYLALVSGLLQTGLNNVTISNAVLTGTNQLINGVKTFLQSPQVPPPSSSGDAVNKSYVDNVVPGFLNVVQLTGDQLTISGVKGFLQSPLVPVATTPFQAVNLAQLNSIGNVMAPITGFAGVISINGTSGSSGYVFFQGAGTVAVTQCGNIFYFSGVGQTLSSLYSASIPLASGATGLSVVYTTPLSFKPVLTDAIEATGGNVVAIGRTIYANTVNGFSVVLSQPTPAPGYSYDFTSFPVTGSGFYALQGQQGNTGPSANVRGFWQVGQIYAPLDIVYAPTYNASFISNATAVSTSLNAPGGTGNGQWALFMTGIQGATGYWTWRGNYSPSTVYNNTNAAFYAGSSYGFTGASPASGFTPDAQTGGWTLVASQGALGYYINSGIVTGNFLNASLYMSPVNTGLDLVDVQIGHTSIITGFQLRCRVSGSGPTSGSALLSGSLYMVGSTNNKTTFQSFTFNSGLYSYYSGGLSVNITGGYSIGVDLLSTLSGIDKFSIGIFGFTSG